MAREWDGTDESMKRRIAERAAEVAANREYAQSPEGRLENLRKQRDALRYDHSDSGADHAETVAALGAEITSLEAEIKAAAAAAHLAEWTREITIARRAAWNAKARTIQSLPRPQRATAIIALERELGFHATDLRWAVELHNL